MNRMPLSQATALRKVCGPPRYRWASVHAPWRYVWGTGRRSYIVRAKRQARASRVTT